MTSIFPRSRYGRRAGISAQQVEHVVVSNCSVFAVGRDGILLNGSDSRIEGATVYNTGCGGIKTTGGDGRTLRAGNIAVTGVSSAQFVSPQLVSPQYTSNPLFNVIPG